MLKADSLSVRIFFPVRQTDFYPDLRGNGENIRRFVAMHDSLTADQDIRVKWVTIVGSASTEGKKELNDELSRKRADQIIAQLRRHISLPNSAIHVELRGADWEELTRLVSSSGVPHKEDVLDIIRYSPVGMRNSDMMSLYGGESYRYLQKYIFPEIRYSKVMIEYMRPKTEEEILRDTVEVVRHDTVVVSAPVVHDTIVIAQPPAVHHDTVIIAAPPVHDTVVITAPAHEKPGFHMALKTNLLSDAAMIPDGGIEICLGRKWSIGADWHYSWWADRKAFCWKSYGGDVFIRRWIGHRSDARPLTGHHLGIYGQMASFDFDAGGDGVLSYPYDFGGGLEYGYSLGVSKRLNIDFSVGVGYLGGEYKRYTPTMNEYPREMHYVWQSTNSFSWIGPTKLEISLVWIIGKMEDRP